MTCVLHQTCYIIHGWLCAAQCRVWLPRQTWLFLREEWKEAGRALLSRNGVGRETRFPTRYASCAFLLNSLQPSHNSLMLAGRTQLFPCLVSGCGIKNFQYHWSAYVTTFKSVFCWLKSFLLTHFPVTFEQLDHQWSINRFVSSNPNGWMVGILMPKCKLEQKSTLKKEPPRRWLKYYNWTHPWKRDTFVPIDSYLFVVFSRIVLRAV